MYSKIFLIIISFIFQVSNASATGPFVLDEAKLFTPVQKQEIFSRLKGLAYSGIVMVVHTVKSLEGVNINDYSLRLANTAMIGEKGKDNGLLLTIALKERQTRLEVGSGLEGEIPDIRSAELIRTVLIPEFIKNRHFEGVVALIQELHKPVSTVSKP